MTRAAGASPQVVESSEAQADPSPVVSDRPGRRRGSAFTGWSLRRKLVASILTLFFALSLATAAATTLTLRKSLDDDLNARVAQLAEQPFPMRDLHSDGDDRFAREGLFAGVVDGTLTGLASDTSGQLRTLSPSHLSALSDAGLGSQPRSIDLGGDMGRYRVVAGYHPRFGVIIRGLPEHRNEQTIARLAWITVAFGISGLVLVGVGGWWLVGANLRPLQRVAATATRVAHLPLSSGAVSLAHERVGAQDTDTRTEVGQVGTALNELLDHVDHSLAARHQSETQLRQFVADASHELRTPLASIKGYAELSRRERAPVPDTVRHALGRIESESARMASLVEDLLLLARLDAGRPLERQPVDLTRLTIDAVSDLRAAGPDHHWRLDLPEEAVEATGDHARLTQVVVNLLNNARVHTPPGTTVTARVRREGTDAVIEVADDGPGIPADQQPTVFRRFARGDASRSRGAETSGTGSTGLGLSIVQAVTEAHGGSVHLDSHPGHTQVSVRLPLSAR